MVNVSKILDELSRVVDAIVLGMMWLLFSIPIVTIGASSAAFYHAYHECIRRRRGYAWKEFISGFKGNFAKATKIWLVVLVVIAIAFVDGIAVLSTEEANQFHGMFLVFVAAILVCTLVWALYLFPCIARFEMRLQTIMKNCGIIAIANLPWTLLLLLIFGIAVFIPLLAPGLCFFTPTAYMFFANRILERVFRKYMTPEDQETQEGLIRND